MLYVKSTFCPFLLHPVLCSACKTRTLSTTSTTSRIQHHQSDLRRGRSLRYLVYLPGGLGAGVLVGGVAPPQALDEGGGGHAAPNHVLLTLLLLNLEREAGAEDALANGKEEASGKVN